MKKKLLLGLAALTILAVATFSGCSPQKTSLPSKEVSTLPFVRLKYIITSLPPNTRIEFNTPWETSPSGGFSATIEGRGENAIEEGYSRIVIENKKSGELTKLTLENEEKYVLTARDLEWMDESNLFVIIGQPFGTVSRGGKIYKVNIITGETILYKDNANSKEEFTAVRKSENGFIFEKYVFEDNNFIKGHNESGNLELK